MIKDYLPTIIAALTGLIGALAGVFANIYLAKLKTSQDLTSLKSTSSDALRDDLFELIETQDGKLQRQESKIEKMQEIIDKLSNNNAELAKERVKLEIRVSELESESTRKDRKIAELQEFISAIENKVWYKPNKEKL